MRFPSFASLSTPLLALFFLGCQATVTAPNLDSPTCDNGIQDGDETGVDCGGSCPPCADDDDTDTGGGGIGADCTTHGQCQSGYCHTNSTCQELPASCHDTCGGTCPACANDAPCTHHTDCESGYCSPSNTTCQDLPASCDGVCGGQCPQCAIGADCTSHAQCLSGHCDGTSCAAMPDCTVVCGDPCPGCIDDPCDAHSECQSGYCDTGTSQCAVDPCESECGGTCPQCDIGGTCTEGNQCISGYCDTGTSQCAVDPCESECGGTCPQCDSGGTCTEGNQCLSGYCDLGISECAVDPCLDACGGDCDVLCDDGEPCSHNIDCDSGYCDVDMCAPMPDCTVDCGGPCLACNEAGCTRHAHCFSGYCDPGTSLCAVMPPKCAEGDACGDVCPTQCPNGTGCDSAADCSSGYCDADTNLCAVDPCPGVCGIGCDDLCDIGQGCSGDDDCHSGYCNGTHCAPEAEKCGNEVLDAGEVCDGALHAGHDCTSFGYEAGDLACKADCSGFITSACTGCLETCGAGTTCINGQCACPFGSTDCGEAGCVTTQTDPEHCGACDNDCTLTGDVCSAGACVPPGSCLYPLVSAGGRCIDPNSDAEFCGAYDTSGDGIANSTGDDCTTYNPPRVCNSGTCEEPLVTLNPIAKCAGGGPPISLGTGGSLDCSGDLAAVTFRWSICSCEAIDISQGMYTDSYNSLDGPYDPENPGIAAGVGTNEEYKTGSHTTTIRGTLWADSIDTGPLFVEGPTYSAKAMTISTSSRLYSHKYLGVPPPPGLSPDDVDNTALMVGGNFSHRHGGNGFIYGDVIQSPSTTFSDKFTIQSGIHDTSSVVQIGPACDCSAGQLIDVDSIVAAHACTGSGADPCAGDNNDNHAAGLHPNVLNGGSGRIDLHCGHYYFSNINTGDSTIYIHGNVAIYVGGDVRNGGPLTITLAPTGRLDLFIAGSLCTEQNFHFGSPNYPANARIYVGTPKASNCSNSYAGGGNTVSVYYNQTPALAGNLYAPFGTMVYNQPVVMYGALFSKYIDGNQKITIHYDRGVIQSGQICEQPGSPGDPGGGDPGDPCDPEEDPECEPPCDPGEDPECEDPGEPEPGCASCRDCNNQACIDGQCGSCTSHSDCCSPLMCFGGTCWLVDG